MSIIVQSLLSERLLCIVAHKYFELGLSCVDVHTASGRVLNIRSCEIEATPFEAYSLDVHDGLCEADVTGQERFDVDFEINSIEVFRRDEWIAKDVPLLQTVGSNPIAIEAGPVGAAPAGTTAISALCGYVFHSNGSSRGGPQSMLVYIVDYPGLIDLTTDDEQISIFRSGTTAERIR